MNREQLVERKRLLLEEHLQVAGHLQEIDYWLALLDQEEQDKPKDEPPAKDKAEG